MGFKRRNATTSKPHIPGGARKERELMFVHSIVKNTTLAKQNSKQVRIAGGSDKLSMAATFMITFNGNFLGMQLIYGDKPVQSLPRYEFAENFF